MSFELITIPCLSDNYAFLAHDTSDKKTLLVDAPEAAPISKALNEKGWRLTDVLLAHHHQDHVDGLQELLKSHPARVIGAKADQHRLPGLPRGRVVLDEVLGDLIQTLPGRDDVVVTPELFLELLLRIDAFKFDFIQGISDPFVEIADREPQLLASGVIEERHSGPVLDRSVEVVG